MRVYRRSLKVEHVAHTRQELTNAVLYALLLIYLGEFLTDLLIDESTALETNQPLFFGLLRDYAMLSFFVGLVVDYLEVLCRLPTTNGCAYAADALTHANPLPHH